MKKSLFFVGAAFCLLLASCGGLSTVTTATTVDVPTAVTSVTVADLNVGERVSFRYTTSKEDRLGGAANCKRAAVAAMLKANGNADVLVAPEYKTDAKVTYVEVTGRPATYKNFRSAN